MGGPRPRRGAKEEFEGLGRVMSAHGRFENGTEQHSYGHTSPLGPAFELALTPNHAAVDSFGGAAGAEFEAHDAPLAARDGEPFLAPSLAPRLEDEGVRAGRQPARHPG